MNISTHNGTITMTNPETGNHRTVKIKTQDSKSHFAPGQRLIGMLTGTDNENSYTYFGFVKANGGIAIWNKFKNTSYEVIAKMVQHKELYQTKKGIIYQEAGCCRRCNRKLTTPESIEDGIGPYCRDKE